MADRRPEKIQAGVVEYDRRTGEILLAFAARDLPQSAFIRATNSPGPTNTAIDNALLAVLGELSPDEKVVTLPLIARLGLATADLLKRYPEVCEDDAIQKELSAIVDELEGIEGELALLASCLSGPPPHDSK